ncbi:choline transporter-like 2 isoform X2 [Cylas formicarius]|uniref:choline transporter-like 2 isoform X2 n=1 Tax=Cylas formicarius TaxID=197179 RepID=UPI002958DE50|nr:choline transporter-like 2 isoform X2 [Cylas formicarius]XP_060534570.1 choline transporter-like 2 isoform X2 [Cylas formicarius]
MAKAAPQAVGQPIRYDPDFNGPLKNRSCTDIICLLLFLVFIACWAGIGWYAIVNGDPSTLLVPRDSSGRRCGMDSDVKDRPYLFFFDLTKCFAPTTPITGCRTEQVCVKSCPDENFLKDVHDTEKAVLFCKYGTSVYNEDDCPTWYLVSESVLSRCLYNVAARNRSFEKSIVVDGDQLAVLRGRMNLVHVWLGMATHNVLSVFSDDVNIHKVAEQVIADVVESWWKILIGVVIALVVCLIYIMMLRWIAAPMVWISIVGVLVALSAAIYFTNKEYVKWKQRFIDEEESSYKTKRDIWLATLILVCIALSVVVLMLLFLRKRILLAIALIKEGSRAVSSVTSSLFFPIFPWILEVGVIAYAICVGLYLATTGQPVYQIRFASKECANAGYPNKTVCNPDNFTIPERVPACSETSCRFIRMENESFYGYLQAINVFGFFWLICFISAMGQMMLAQVFAQWYWTFQKRNLPFFALTSAVYRTLRYHIGTLAFGSLIIAICKIIRACLEYIDHKLKKYDNEITKVIMCCLKCFFWCLENFLKFLNKNAYIMCAIHGKGFCASARDAFMLLMRNIVRVFVLDKVTDFLFFLSKVLVTVGVGAVAYLCFATDLVSFIDNSSLNYGVVPVIIIMIATYLIASLFFSVYSMAVDTLFLCFLEDCERNDGSPDKPYYMSKNLMKIFGKRNKIKYN